MYFHCFRRKRLALFRAPVPKVSNVCRIKRDATCPKTSQKSRKRSRQKDSFESNRSPTGDGYEVGFDLVPVFVCSRKFYLHLMNPRTQSCVP